MTTNNYAYFTCVCETDQKTMISSFAELLFGEERYSTFSLCWTPEEKFTVPVCSLARMKED